MKENLKKISIKFIENPIPIFVLIIYILGFLIWNYYLNSFGFFEYNIVQLRYFSAGLLFVFVCLIPFLVFYIFLVRFIHKTTPLIILRLVLVALFLWWSIYFVNHFFPQIPQYWGGIRPLPVSIIGSQEQIIFLSNFNILPAENGSSSPSVQTKAVCLVYQNDDYVLIFNASDVKLSTETNMASVENIRAIEIQKNSFIGIQSMNDPVSNNQCELSKLLYNGNVKLLYSKK